ncbi:hypothetical protein ROZALSC1DRAFT_26684 [Rozella allomycis CSF55]|uniref:Signal peptidase complex subunit 2 n=1 Tax=Rozella allomycis (strain CSF55) TaxID=988480 RepID=A0A075B204_ROZAC|nr:hypothetical protein O9G_002907 [Rozella allomycis CSF55]RKP21924.1 hypothetical protein ROZALSC1DRAFT_26684 [Rozella allomycis CSF55]|eukprot:EPZ36405.1 hypothetical protein O9G_002907 [Rozella allomycis CSF55]
MFSSPYFLEIQKNPLKINPYSLKTVKPLLDDHLAKYMVDELKVQESSKRAIVKLCLGYAMAIIAASVALYSYTAKKFQTTIFWSWVGVAMYYFLNLIYFLYGKFYDRHAVIRGTINQGKDKIIHFEINSKTVTPRGQYVIDCYYSPQSFSFIGNIPKFTVEAFVETFFDPVGNFHVKEFCQFVDSKIAKNLFHKGE